MLKAKNYAGKTIVTKHGDLTFDNKGVNTELPVAKEKELGEYDIFDYVEDKPKEAPKTAPKTAPKETKTVAKKPMVRKPRKPDAKD